MKGLEGFIQSNQDLVDLHYDLQLPIHINTSILSIFLDEPRFIKNITNQNFVHSSMSIDLQDW